MLFLSNITKRRQLEVRMKLLLRAGGAFVTTRSFIQQVFRQCLQCNGLSPGFGSGGGEQGSLTLWSSPPNGKRKVIYKKTNKQINIILHVTKRQGEKPSKVVEKAGMRPRCSQQGVREGLQKLTFEQGVGGREGASQPS